MALRQRHRGLRVGHDRRHADPALSRPSDRRAGAAAGPHAARGPGSRHAGLRRTRLGARLRPLGERQHGSRGVSAHRALPPRRHDARLDLRVRRRARRKARLDGAGRQHDLRALARAARPGTADAHGQGARQLPRLPRNDAGRRLAHGRGRSTGGPAGHRVRRRAPAPAARAWRRGRAGPHLVPRLRPAARGRARPGPRGGSPARGDLPRATRSRRRPHPRALGRGGAVARRRGRGRAPRAARGRRARALGAGATGGRHGAAVDPPARPRRRSVRGAPSPARRPRRRHRHRRLSLVRRLGPRHDDRAAGPHAGHRPPRGRAQDPDDVRALRGSRDAAEPLPRRRRGARVQHGGRDALVRRGAPRVSRVDRR